MMKGASIIWRAAIVLAIVGAVGFSAISCKIEADGPGGGTDGTKTLQSIAITKNPAKMTYATGEQFQAAGMEVTATYSDQSKAVVTGYATDAPATFEQEGSIPVTITYQGKTATLSVLVNPPGKTLSGIAITTQPTKLVYWVGETFDPAGMVVTATYSDESAKAVTDYTTAPASFSTAGQITVTVTFGGKTANITVTVKTPELVSIRIDTQPTKREYWVGEAFDPTGMVVTATYDDESTKAVTDYTTAPATFATAGEITVTVTFGGKTANITVTVKTPELVSIRIDTQPTKREYWVGEAFDPTGMVVTATYSDESSKAATGYATNAPATFATAGEITVTVTFGGKTADITVTVKTPELSGIAITTPPTKLVYWVGETFDPAGMVVTATYSDESAKAVTGYATNAPASFATAGEITVTVTFGGKTANITVTVKMPELVSIRIDTQPTKREYWVGEAFDPTGMIVTATYEDESTKPVTDYNTNAPASFTTAGIATVTVTLAGKTADITVTVKTPELSGIVITTPPAKLVYWVGETFDPTGMIVTATYSDDSTRPVTDYSTAPASFTSDGEITVTVTFGGKTANITVTVKMPELVSIRIDTQPAKHEYWIGEAFDPTGMVVTATYSDESTKAVTGYATNAPATFGETGPVTITITYQGKTADITVTVKAPTVTITSTHILTAQGLELAFAATVTLQSAPPPVTWSVTGNDKASFTGNVLKVAADAKPGTITVKVAVNEYPELTDERSITILPSIAIAAGNTHTAAIKSDGSLWAWGANSRGQLGNNSTTDSLVPVQEHSKSTWVSVSVGSSHTAAIKSDGSLWSWGSGRELGNNATTDSPVPVQEHSKSTWVSVSAGAGGGHTAAIKSDGSLWAWGANWYGQLGNNSTTESLVPVQEHSKSTWVSVSTGGGAHGDHTAAIKSDGTLWAWGANWYGKLGNNSTTESHVPVQEHSKSTWVSVSAGFTHTAAIKSDGSLWAWGVNWYGQLGNSSTTESHVPVQEHSKQTWVSVSARGFHTAAIQSDGSLWAWGFNSVGQLGDNSTTDSHVPLLVPSLSTWVSVSGGTVHTAAIQSDGSLWAWGNNEYGQLGINSTNDSLVPLREHSNSTWRVYPVK